MLLVVDAGNTNVVFAVHDGTGWRGTWRLRTDAQRTSDEYAVWLLTLLTHAGLRKDDIAAAVIGTVVPAALYHLRHLCREWFAVEPLIARAPLQLFQAIQTSLLPHLTGLEVTEGHQAFARAIRVTVLAIAAFAGAVALGLLAIGPPVMQHLFGQHHDYNRFGLALIGLGMGMHLTSGALNQAVLARNQARTAAVCWLVAAAVFVVWMVFGTVGEELLRTEIGYLGAASLLALMLGTVYKRGARGSQSAPAAATIAR